MSIQTPGPAPYDLTYLSLGAGVQSSALLVMSALGLRGCQKADIAIFADTGSEPRWVYENLARLEAWGDAHGLPVKRTAYRDLFASGTTPRLGLSGLVAGREYIRTELPLFVKGSANGMLSRSCTSDYKVKPIRRLVRRMLGIHGKRAGHGKRALCLLGISYDERIRCKPSGEEWVENRWPLVEERMDRAECEAVLAFHGLPIPKKSACVFCPYHSDEYWRMLQENDPEGFEKACRFDDGIRLGPCPAQGEVYVHRSCVPLRQIDFSAKQYAPKSVQGSFVFSCDSGHCGV